MKPKKKIVRRKPKFLSITADTAELEAKDKVRLAIECTSEERKYIKAVAALEDRSINDFVLHCVWKYIKCTKSHVPNKETAEALEASERGEGHRVHKSIDDMFKFFDI